MVPTIQEERAKESVCIRLLIHDVKKHEQSQSHKDAAGAFHAQVGPSPTEVALQSMERVLRASTDEDAFQHGILSGKC